MKAKKGNLITPDQFTALFACLFAKLICLFVFGARKNVVVVVPTPPSRSFVARNKQVQKAFRPAGVLCGSWRWEG